MVFIFPYIGNVIIPTDELIFFRGVGLNHQPDGIAVKFTVGVLEDVVSVVSDFGYSGS